MCCQVYIMKRTPTTIRALPRAMFQSEVAGHLSNRDVAHLALAFKRNNPVPNEMRRRASEAQEELEWWAEMSVGLLRGPFAEVDRELKRLVGTRATAGSLLVGVAQAYRDFYNVGDQVVEYQLFSRRFGVVWYGVSVDPMASRVTVYTREALEEMNRLGTELDALERRNRVRLGFGRTTEALAYQDRVRSLRAAIHDLRRMCVTLRLLRTGNTRPVSVDVAPGLWSADRARKFRLAVRRVDPCTAGCRAASGTR